jgi:hypothetical protein
MQGKELRKILENALMRLGYNVTYEPMDDGKGGKYRLREKREVIIDSKLAEDEKAGILIETLKGLDTSGVYLPPVVRRLLGDEDS